MYNEICINMIDVTVTTIVILVPMKRTATGMISNDAVQTLTSVVMALASIPRGSVI